MKSGRGGVRENAGRKTSWVSGRRFDRTKPIRVPIEFADQLLAIAHKLDAGETLDSVTKTSFELVTDSLLAKELVTESLERALIDLVTEPKQQSNSDQEEKELVTKSIERVIIDSVKDVLTKWRKRSDEAKITSPKSERWANARKILDELEPIVFEIGYSPSGVEAKAVEAVPSLVPQTIDLDTKSIVDKVELLELVTKTKVAELEGKSVESPNQLNLLEETEYQANGFEPKTFVPTSLTRTELAERFGIKVESLSNRVTGKMASAFSEWSQKKDPYGIAWQYYPEAKLFFPLIENVTNSKAEAKSEN